MSDLFWPGDERAGDLMSNDALLAAMVSVEAAWLDGLVAVGIAPAEARHELTHVVGPDDLDILASSAEGGGNPVIPLVKLLRERLRDTAPHAAHWLHRGLTSQDVVDTAVMLSLREVKDRVNSELGAQARSLSALADRHRGSVMAGRTLGQHAVPTTFGLKAAGWLQGVLDARDVLAATCLPSQLGGAAGTQAASVELARSAGLPDPVGAALQLVHDTTEQLGLIGRTPWHTTRACISRVGDGLVTCTDAWGHLAGDVITLSRSEIAEVAEPSARGRGGSSTMAHKQNPILSTLIRRAALAAPGLASTLHLAAAESGDERPAGAWHVEWATLRTLGRRTVVAAAQASELLDGLVVDVERMRTTAEASLSDLLAEQVSMRGMFGLAPGIDAADYLGLSDHIIDRALDRARDHLGGEAP